MRGSKYWIRDSPAETTPPSHIRGFAVDEGRLRNRRVFADYFESGMSDEVRTDVRGNVWSSTGWGARRMEREDWSARGLSQTASASRHSLYVNVQRAQMP